MHRRNALVLLAFGAAVLAAASVCRGRFEALAEQRLTKILGAPVEISELHWAGGSVWAREVLIDGSDRGIRLRLERVSVSPSLRDLVTRRRVAIARVEVADAEARIDERILSRLAVKEDTGPAGPIIQALPGLQALFSKQAVVEFEEMELTFSSQRRELLTLRGEMNGVNTPSGFRLRGSARTANEGRVLWSAGLDAGGATVGSLRFQKVGIRPLLDLIPQVAWHRSDATTVDGTLEFSVAGRGQFALLGVVDVRGIGVEWRAVADTTVAADVGLELRAVWNGRALEVEQGRFRSRSASIEWGGKLGWAEGRAFADVAMRLPPTPCSDVLNAVPASLLGEFSRFGLEGTISASMRLHFDAKRTEATELEVGVSDGCRFHRAPHAANLDQFRGVFRHRVPGGNGETLTFESGPGSRQWTPLSRVSPFLIHAVLSHEDATFFHHSGFAPDAFEVALARNLEEGRFAAGASTISMQLARNLFLSRDKTLARKLQEILLTWWLEKRLTKEEILELYLNLIEFGPGTYGVGPAASHYFGRTPETLSPAESAFLAVVLPSPSAYHRQYERGRLSPSTLDRMEHLLRHMAAMGRIDHEALAHGLGELAVLRFHDAFRRAPTRGDFMGTAAPLPVPAAIKPLRPL